MENRSTIVSELQEISLLVAGIQPLNPYSVPEGYFDGLPDTILSSCQSQQTDLQPTVAPFGVPQGYFDSFPAILMEKIRSVQAVGEDENSEILSSISRSMPYSVPIGYFDQLPNIVVQNTTGSRTEIGPVLEGLKQMNPYLVPPAYFENFPSLVLARATRPQAKVVSMRRPARVIQFAAAAVVVGLLIMAGILYFNRPLTQEGMANIEQVSVDELENYLDTESTEVIDNADMSSAEIDAEDVREIIAELPDAALQQYLIQYTDVKIETVN